MLVNDFRLGKKLMLVAFVESIKYVGHMIPIAFLRIFLGYYYVNQALLRLSGEYHSHAYLAEDIRTHLPVSLAPDWYKTALETIVIPNWQVFAIGITTLHMAIGVSYVIGYLVRPFSMIAAILSVGMIAALGANVGEHQTTMFVVLHFTLGWLGAGRCLGVDYYFYKRRRGIWW